MQETVKGEMSLVGSRAYMPSEQEDMGDYAPIILRIQPGLTGWWQVMGRHGTTFEQRLRMDEEHQQLVAVDGHLYPDENSLGGPGREGGVDVSSRGTVAWLHFTGTA